MPSPLREEFPGAVHHVFARGNDRQAIYRDDVDCRIYLSMLGRVVLRQQWRLLAFCLMRNHVHLLVETPRPNLAAGMQRLHSGYAQLHNERHGRVGHLFQGRYGSVRIEDDAQLWMTVAYIARNPVTGGLCERAEDWPWSSHAATLAGSAPRWLDADRLLAYLAAAGGDPRRRYAELTAYS
ncbi:MAG TPA: transposase [Solirubrobacteraceae bacterium]|jgi:REP element-mobilizing transposase RayT|nr:transposase [Solirubrobacteraceae bacterium]